MRLKVEKNVAFEENQHISWIEAVKILGKPTYNTILMINLRLYYIDRIYMIPHIYVSHLK